MNDAITTTATARNEIRSFDLSILPETLEAAYGFQDDYVAAVGQVGGFKLAVNGAPQMAHFGVDEPVSARIFASEVYASGVRLKRSQFQEISVEPELAAILGEGVQDVKAPLDRAVAQALIERFHPAIELIDQRGFSVPQLKLAQAVALNVFNAGCVIGADSVAPADLDLGSLHVTIEDDGVQMGEATNNAPQDPVEAVMWLLNSLRARGITAEPGMVVMCGTHLPLRALAPAVETVQVSMSGVGAVSFALDG